MKNKKKLQFTNDELDFLSEVFHEYKDFRRGEKESILKAMNLEKKLSEALNYTPDTTYDIK